MWDSGFGVGPTPAGLRLAGVVTPEAYDEMRRALPAPGSARAPPAPHWQTFFDALGGPAPWSGELAARAARVQRRVREDGASYNVHAPGHDGSREWPLQLLPFIVEGLERRERAFHIVDPTMRSDHLERLNAAGIDVAGAEQRGQLEVRVWAEAYLREGHFDQDAMLALIQQVLEEGPRQGFPLTRLVAHMEWALEDRPGVDDLVEYETRLNYLLPRYPDPVI